MESGRSVSRAQYLRLQTRNPHNEKARYQVSKGRDPSSSKRGQEEQIRGLACYCRVQIDSCHIGIAFTQRPRGHKIFKITTEVQVGHNLLGSFQNFGARRTRAHII